MRKRMRGGVVFGAVVAASLVLAACGSSDSSSTPGGDTGGGPTGSITVNGSQPENPLIPTATNETGGGNVIDAMWTGLVRYDVDTGAPINAMAESIESSDNTNWTIKIKQGWKFHDGTEVKAKNFVDAWNYGAYGPNGQNNNYFFAPFKGYDDLNPAPAADGSTPEPAAKEMSGVKAVDDYTITVELSSPVSVFPVMIGYSAFDPMPDSFFADPKGFEAKPIGNGPFQFVSFTPSQSIKLTAFPDYAGDNKPKVKDVDFKIYQSLDAAYTDVIANNLDVLDAIPSNDLAGDPPLYTTDLPDRNSTKPIAVIQTVTFPLYDKAFDNVQLRKAISEAIDREKVISIAFPGRQPADGWVNPGTDGYQPNACGDACVFNPTQAKADFKAAGGYDGVLTLAYNADGGHKEWVDATCASISDTLGVKCQGKAYPEFGPFREAVVARKMTGMFRTGWQADYPSIQNYLEPLYATGASANDGEWSNATFDEDMKKAAAASTPEEANKIYNDSQAELAKDMPVIPMWFSTGTFGWSENVDNVKFNWQGRIDLSSITVKG
jgi:oligopeptide transport system substrate-binding protein